MRIFCGILSTPHNIIMDMNIIMFAIMFIHCQGEEKNKRVNILLNFHDWNTTCIQFFCVQGHSSCIIELKSSITSKHSTYLKSAFGERVKLLWITIDMISSNWKYTIVHEPIVVIHRQISIIMSSLNSAIPDLNPQKPNFPYYFLIF